MGRDSRSGCRAGWRVETAFATNVMRPPRWRFVDGRGSLTAARGSRKHRSRPMNSRALLAGSPRPIVLDCTLLRSGIHAMTMIDDQPKSSEPSPLDAFKRQLPDPRSEERRV